MLLKIVVGVVALGVLATGGYFAVKEDGVRALKEVLRDRLEAGDYLAALTAAGKIKEKGEATEELETTIAEAARFLVAEGIYRQAVKASGEERWVDARALLTGSEAVSNPSFKYYEEAKRLLQKTEALAADVAHKTAVTISTLEEKAKIEQSKRQELEQKKKKLEGTLSEKEKSLSQSRAETVTANQKAEQSKKDAEDKQVALLQEQARANQLMEQVEKESKQKFFNEFRMYRDMAQKGREQLDNAIIEINSKRDVTAIVSVASVYIGQGKILFDEAKNKIADFRGIRTPAAYAGRVDDLVNSLSQFLESSKQLRNALLYIDDQGSAEFTESFSKEKNAFGVAVSLLSGVSDFLAGQ